MTRKKPTKRRAKRKIDDLKEDVGAGDDVEVNIRTFSVDLAETVEDVDADDGVVLSTGGTCDVDGCDESALVDVDRCAYHYDGDSDVGTDT